MVSQLLSFRDELRRGPGRPGSKPLKHPRKGLTKSTSPANRIAARMGPMCRLLQYLGRVRQISGRSPHLFGRPEHAEETSPQQERSWRPWRLPIEIARKNTTLMKSETRTLTTTGSQARLC